MKKSLSRFSAKLASSVGLFLVYVQVALAQGATIVNPLGSTVTLCGFLKNLLNVVLAVGVPFLVLWLIYGGFLMVMSRGNPAKLEKAKRNIAWTIGGIVLILGAWTVMYVIANTIVSIQQSSGTSAGNASLANCN